MRGQCLCGAVHYELHGAPRPVVACHCLQCRKTSGHYVAATQIETVKLTVTGDDHLAWYQSSETARRGFCKTCGSSLFWQRLASQYTSVMAGTIDGATDLTMDSQLYPESKGDYYDLPDVAVVEQAALSRN